MLHTHRKPRRKSCAQPNKRASSQLVKALCDSTSTNLAVINGEYVSAVI
jgi:hypothetical protein